MGTCQDVIDRALRLMGVTAAGQVASGHEAAHGLQRLQDILNSLPLLRDGEWKDVVLTGPATHAAADGERIHTAGHAASIVLPAAARRDLSRVQVLGAHPQQGLWLYCASRGVWSRIDALKIGDACPLGPEDDLGLACLLAMDLAGEYGAEVPGSTAGRAAAALNSFRARLYREVEVAADMAVLANADLGLPHERLV